MDIELTVSVEEGSAQGHSVSAGTRELPLIVLRQAGKLGVFLNSCPHAGVRLDWRGESFFDYSGSYLRCSLHGALFETGSGRCVAGPCLGARLVPIAHRSTLDGGLVITAVERIPARAMPGSRR